MGSLQYSTKYSRKFRKRDPDDKHKVEKIEAARTLVNKIKKHEKLIEKPTKRRFRKLVSEFGKRTCLGSFFNPGKVQSNRWKATADAPWLSERGSKLYTARAA